ncbi:MAG: CPBP family intramembrane metalloprotease [Actinomycetota bacterium]|nr:CPBP family intramembrane metalloprotease [Actinomycetota bacterium]
MSDLQETIAPSGVRWTVLDVALAVAVGTGVGIVWSALTYLLLRDSGLSESVKFFILGTEVYAGVALMTWLLVLKRRGARMSDAGLRKVGPGPILLMVPLTLGVLFVNGVIAQITAAVFGDVPNAQDQLAIEPATITTVDLICLLLVVAVVAPVVEEFVFRGLLYRSARSKWGIGVASVISAVAFACLHFIPLLLGVFFVFGLILAAVAQRFDSIYPAIVVHALNNAVSIGLLYAAR